MRRALLILSVTVALSGLGGCGDNDRPDVGGWTDGWQGAASYVPDAGTDPDDLTRRACDDLLVAARDARPDLLPTPSPPLDDLVDEWIVQAESIGFDCHGHPDPEAAIAELNLLTDRIDERLQILREG